MTTPPQISCSLSISCVVYDTPVDILKKTIESLSHALKYARDKGILSDFSFYLINNRTKITDAFNEASILASSKFNQLHILTGHGNIGYGRANNLAIKITNTDFHLILNPDVDLHQDSIFEGLSYLQKNPRVGLAAPTAYNPNGEIEYLAKRSPSPLVIILRGLNIYLLNRWFKQKLDWYTYKDKLPTNTPMKIELASGSFMLCSTAALKNIHGFSHKYFLYFEDFDLSRRLRKSHDLVLLPSMIIVHHGGNTANKTINHQVAFLRSAVRFMLTR